MIRDLKWGDAKDYKQSDGLEKDNRRRIDVKWVLPGLALVVVIILVLLVLGGESAPN